MEEQCLSHETLNLSHPLPNPHADSNQVSGQLFSSPTVVESPSLVSSITPVSTETLDSTPLSRNHHVDDHNQEYDCPSGAVVGDNSTIITPISPISTETLDPLPPLLNHNADYNHEVDKSSSAVVEGDSSSDPSALLRNSSFSSLNAQAPEFVPARTDLNMTQQCPLVGNMHVQHRQIHHHHHSQQSSQQPASDSEQASSSRNSLSEDSIQKILNQVEYYFSDLNLATTDHLMRFINKDPEGFVPMSVVSGFKKIKSITSSHSQLAEVLRNSRKLLVSEDGKKLRRRHLLTELDMEELQSRIVVAENLPEDHCYQNLMKIFSTMGSVKTIRTCQHQNSNGGGSSASRFAKADSLFFSNKLHAFVEYESAEMAEKAVAELNREGSWRNSLRVWLLAKRKSRSRVKKMNNDGEGEEDDGEQQKNVKLSDEADQPVDDHHTQTGEEGANEIVQQRKGSQGRNRGRGNKGSRGPFMGSPHINANNGSPNQPPGPRMPDGTKGFAMGRGKPLIIVNTTA